MAHDHENCLTPQGGSNCAYGLLLDYCSYEECNNDMCTDVGHCECNCHSGKECGCGYVWDL